MLLEVFTQIQLFDGLNSAQLASLAPLFSSRSCSENEVIFSQGDEAKHLYVVLEGCVAICFNPDDGEPIIVSHIEKDGVFGWSAAFGSEHYTSGATCLEETKLLCVRGQDLKKFHENHPKTGILVLDRLAKVVARRLKRTHTHDQVVAMLEHGLKNGVKPLGG
ncbi:MAG: Crp/Fnr family transcriptional regulator [Chloroflexi bacterium]|nr:Crp/Fnr family transcriptional regulator [Chloroflexota bacterium]